MFYRKYVFGDVPGGTVRADDLYSPEKGFGFVVERNRREQERLRLPELNSAFDTVYWYQGEELSRVEEDCIGCFLDSDREIAALEPAAAFQGEHRRIPLCFKADVPRQGNYRVTVTIRGAEPMEDVMIFTGRRRLGYRGTAGGPVGAGSGADTVGAGVRSGLETELGNAAGGPVGAGSGADTVGIVRQSDLGTEAGIAGTGECHSPEVAGSAEKAGTEEFVYTMSVNVCDIIPRGQTQVYTDKSLDIAVLARRPRISRIEVEELDCPTVFIAGDSTVTDQGAEYPYAPGTSYSGWGQMISGYLNREVAVSNHAHSGLTTASFRDEGHYGIVQQ